MLNLALFWTAAVSLSLPGDARAEMAAAGTALVGAGSTRMPSPRLEYRTRLAWIVASYHDNVDPDSPLTNIINNATVPPLARKAIDAELAYIKTLRSDSAAAYYRALVDDYAALELGVFDEESMSRPLKAGLIDLGANVLVTMMTNRFFNELVDKYSAAIKAEQRVQEAFTRDQIRSFARGSVDAAEARIVDFNAFLQKSREAAAAGLPVAPRVLDPSRMTSLEDYFQWASARPYREAERKAFAEALANVPAGMTKAERNLWGTRVLEAVAGTLPGPAAGALFGPLGGDLGVAQLRSQAVMCFLESHCGCSSPRGDKPPAPSAWYAFLPAVQQSYQTRLGRLIGSSSKLGFSVMMGNTRFRQELDRLKTMRAKRPVAYTSFLVHFIQDIDALQAEFTAEARETAGFVENLAASFIASTVPGSLASAFALSASATPVTVAGLLLSAGFSSMNEYANFSAERKVIVSMQLLRKRMIDVLARSTTDCGCHPTVTVGSGGTRKGVKNLAETQR